MDTRHVAISAVSYRYGQRLALDDFSLNIGQGEIFAFLGPNGSGKTTLFRLLSTLIPLQTGSICVAGFDTKTDLEQVRRNLGVVFQAPSLDRKLSVRENLQHQGRLYGLAGSELRSRSDEMLSRLKLSDRSADLVESLSGGLRRRVELAKCLLHRPSVLLLDEPSTGLDPGARLDLWQYLTQLRNESDVTVILTTHLLDEADRADRIAILHEGREVALGKPVELRSTVGGDSITITCHDPAAMAESIRTHLQLDAQVMGDSVRLEQADGHQLIPQLAEEFGQRIDSITLGKPTLEDVFIQRTGHQFVAASESA